MNSASVLGNVFQLNLHGGPTGAQLKPVGHSTITTAFSEKTSSRPERFEIVHAANAV